MQPLRQVKLSFRRHRTAMAGPVVSGPRIPPSSDGDAGPVASQALIPPSSDGDGVPVASKALIPPSSDGDGRPRGKRTSNSAVIGRRCRPRGKKTASISGDFEDVGRSFDFPAAWRKTQGNDCRSYLIVAMRKNPINNEGGNSGRLATPQN